MKVKQWSFCAPCKGRGCKLCHGTGKIVSEVELEQIPKPYQWEYRGIKRRGRRSLVGDDV